MSVRPRSRPWPALTRHFFHAFFRPGFLDDAGEESFKRAIIGVLAGIFASGLLLADVYFRKYRALAGQPTADLYRWMLPADQLLIICLPMLAVAFVMALVAHSLFPDETDFRILMALPVSRKVVFSAKLAALFLFAAIFIVSANVGIGVPFSMASSGRWADRALGARALAQNIAGMLASVFAAASVIAIEGVIVVFTPRRWLRKTSVVTQTALICSLVLSLPFVVRVPTLSPYLAAEAPWLYFAPPAWFLGVQQWLLGSPDVYFTRLAAGAILGSATMMMIGAGCYLILCRRFDQVVFCTEHAATPSTSTSSYNVRLSWPVRRHPAYQAVQEFTSATLRRSGLHQLVFVGIFAAGFAVAVNSVLGSIGLSARWLISAVLGAPLTLIVAAVVGLRAAMLLPANLRAAWVFRLTEEAGGRSHQLNAIKQVLVTVGVIGPIALTFPVQAAVLGLPAALACIPVLALLGLVLVEIVVSHWRRIPFTCTLLFGKHPAAYTLVFAFLAFSVFVAVGTGLQQIAISQPLAWLIVVAILSLAAAALRWIRLQTWGRLPLEFEDYLPDKFETLGLQ
jgi:hypothetical protein